MRNGKKIHIFALAAAGEGLSGGDRIFIEFARRWQKKADVYIYVNEEGREMCRRQRLGEGKSIKYIVWNTKKWQKYGFVVTYFARIVRSVIEAFRLQLPTSYILHPTSYIFYSASEFWMDSFPAAILKIRFPKVSWAASWYQTAPNPFRGYQEGKGQSRYRLSAFLYWLAQAPVKPLVSYFADIVLVNNEEERKRLRKSFPRSKISVVLGAVDLGKIHAWQKSHLTSDVLHRSSFVYDAVFQGRFHPQKGVIELIEIWRKVVDKKPDAKLAMIGDGPLMRDVRSKISALGLENNIKLLGYVFDGDEKYKTFSQSKIVVHPALYDSGGMATAEAMAFGLPAIGFNLKAYESYYPKGMIKAQNSGDFSGKIIQFLDNSSLREKVGLEAKKFIEEHYSWETRSNEVYKVI